MQSSWMKEIYKGEEEREDFYLLSCTIGCYKNRFLTVAAQVGFAKQAFHLPFCIIRIKYTFQKKEESCFSGVIKSSGGFPDRHMHIFRSRMLFWRAASCECAAAGFRVPNNLHSETAESSIFMDWWDHPWHAATSASSSFTPHPFPCKFQVLISCD